MKNPWKFSTMFAPDGGGAGDPDPDPDNGGGDPAKAAKSDNTADLKAIADSIRQGFVSAAEASRPVASVIDNTDATRRALESEATAVNTQVDELFAAGRASEAMALREQFARKASSLLAAPAGDNPIIKTAVALGERVARTDAASKPVMDRWGDEVRRAVEAMPAEQRVLPDAWDTAIARVRANHFTELMEETVTARVSEERAKFVPPPSVPGSRSRQPLTGAAAKLSEEQVWGADITGVTPDEYAKSLAEMESYDSLPFKERAKFSGYAVMNDPRGNSTVAPGKF